MGRPTRRPPLPALRSPPGRLEPAGGGCAVRSPTAAARAPCGTRPGAGCGSSGVQGRSLGPSRAAGSRGCASGGGCRCRLNGGVEDPVPQSAPETATSRGVRTLPGAAPVAGPGPPGSAARTRRRPPPGQAGRSRVGRPRALAARRGYVTSVCVRRAPRGGVLPSCPIVLLPRAPPACSADGVIPPKRSPYLFTNLKSQLGFARNAYTVRYPDD